MRVPEKSGECRQHRPCPPEGHGSSWGSGTHGVGGETGDPDPPGVRRALRGEREFWLSQAGSRATERTEQSQGGGLGGRPQAGPGPVGCIRG